MARGWESKAVESQLEEKGARDAEYARRYEASPEVRARRERIESLRLSRARTLDQLERAATPAHREMLKRTLLAIEREVAELE
jgi:arginine/ornithine N-succinyltransferase beta subunit